MEKRIEKTCDNCRYSIALYDSKDIASPFSVCALEFCLKEPLKLPNWVHYHSSVNECGCKKFEEEQKA